MRRAQTSNSAAQWVRTCAARWTAQENGRHSLFYAPLHFIAVTEVIRALATSREAPATILDLGCGTGAAGAAWALACRSTPGVVGIDRHPWAIDEAQWTYQQLGSTDELVGETSGARRPRGAARPSWWPTC